MHTVLLGSETCFSQSKMRLLNICFGRELPYFRDRCGWN